MNTIEVCTQFVWGVEFWGKIKTKAKGTAPLTSPETYKIKYS